MGAEGLTRPGVERTVLVVEDDAAMAAEVVAAAAVFAPVSTYCASTLDEADRLVRRRPFDLAVIDLHLPDGSGFDLIRRLAATVPAPVCLARTMFDDDAHLLAALGAGVHGYLLKGDTIEDLQSRLVAAMQGELVVSPAIARRVLAFFRQHPGAAGDAGGAVGGPPLTPRERDALRLIAQGMTIPEAAAALGVSENTAKSHVKGAYAKLDVRTRAGAVEAARRLGLLSDR